MRRIKEELFLDFAGVDEVSRRIAIWLTDQDVPRRDLLRVRLTMEELLLRVCEHTGGGIEGTLFLRKNSRGLFIRFCYTGEPFNPITEREDALGEETDRILAYMGLSPSWSYRSGKNTLSQILPLKDSSSSFMMIGALVLALVLGVCGAVIPEELRQGLQNFLLVPVRELFTRLLNIFLGPMVFFSVVTGISRIGSAAEFSRIGKQMVSRYIGFTILGAAAAVLTRPAFVLSETATGSGESQLLSIRDMLLEIVPPNPVRPFYDGNTLQIIFMAVFIGAILLSAGDRGTRAAEVAVVLNDLTAQAVGAVCRLLPLFIMASFTLQIWESGIKTLAGLWKPLVLCVGMCSLFLTVKMTVVCSRLKVRPSVLFGKIYPSMLIGFSTASGSAAFSFCKEVNEKKLGIPPLLTQIGYPLGAILYSVCLAVVFVLTSYTCAEACGAGGGVGWMLTIWVVSTIVSFAVPPVTGGTMACAGILITQLGLPADAMALAGILTLLLDYVATGFGLGLRHLEIALQADRLGMLDREVLRR